MFVNLKFIIVPRCLDIFGLNHHSNQGPAVVRMYLDILLFRIWGLLDGRKYLHILSQ